MESEDLRNAGLKVTHPRLRILSLLEQAKPRHMTAEDIYRHLLEHGEDIGLATVYRVLTQFEAAGLVLKHNFEAGQSVYELDRGHHHDHMVDIDTGKITLGPLPVAVGQPGIIPPRKGQATVEVLAVNAVMAENFKAPYPARSTIEVSA